MNHLHHYYYQRNHHYHRMALQYEDRSNTLARQDRKINERREQTQTPRKSGQAARGLQLPASDPSRGWPSRNPGLHSPKARRQKPGLVGAQEVLEGNPVRDGRRARRAQLNLRSETCRRRAACLESSRPATSAPQQMSVRAARSADAGRSEHQASTLKLQRRSKPCSVQE